MGPALELAAISKSFGGFQALAEVCFTIVPGEVHALLGENGAGKSSLMNIAAGLYRPDSGVIRVRGQPVALGGPLDAKRLGIGMVHQHYKLVKSLDAVDNVLLSRRGAAFRHAKSAVEREMGRHNRDMGFEIDLKRPVGSLSVAEQQRVEILKVLVEGANVIILDEPTAVLTDKEADRLLSTMRTLSRQGAAVVLVTHKLGEVKSHADRVTVMRGGRTIATVDPKTHAIADLTTLIIGASIADAPRPTLAAGASVLSVVGLAGRRSDGHPALADATFEIRCGEIYGLAGVGGNGQGELAEMLMGVRQPDSGSILLTGFGDITRASPRRRRVLGLVSIPADRQTFGLAGDLSIIDNFAVDGVVAGRFGGWLRVRTQAMAAMTADAVRAFDVQGVRSIKQRAGLLSGGNAQKLVIAREFSRAPRLVLAHSPSRGLDVRASAEVHRRLLVARDAGAGVLLISEDLDEILLLSDRVGVMSRGRIVADFKAPADRQAIGTAMVHHA